MLGAIQELLMHQHVIFMTAGWVPGGGSGNWAGGGGGREGGKTKTLRGPWFVSRGEGSTLFNQSER